MSSRSKVEKNRYAKDWDTYSDVWSKEYGDKYEHLGDEWNDDQTDDRKRDTFYYRTFFERWLTSDTSVLEVGPGSGKWTVRVAPNVAHVTVLDVSQEMLDRTEKRCKDSGITNVSYQLIDGDSFQPIAESSVDFFFSFDVFVHIALEDTFPYAHEMARVLKPGGRGVCHYAINSVPDAWDRIEQMNHWYKGAKNTLGQYYYHSPETLRRMFERCGLRVVETMQEWAYCTTTFEKPKIDVVPKLEGLLWELMSVQSDDEAARERCCQALESLPDQLAESIRPFIKKIRDGEDLYARADPILHLRRAWRGL